MPEPASTGATLQLISMFGLAGLTIAAIGTITYLIIKHKNKQKQLTHASSGSVCHNDIIYTYDPDTKSIVESAAPISKKSDDSNLRQRHVNQSKNKSENSNETKNISTATAEVQTDPINDNYDINQNNNNMKVLNDKDFSSLSYEERVAEYIRNIPAEVMPGVVESDTASCSGQSESSSWSNISSQKSTDTPKKAYKKKLHKSFRKYVDNTLNANCERAQSSRDDNSDSSSSVSTSSMSDLSDVSSVKSNDDFEKEYKRKMHRSFKKFVKNMSKGEPSKTSSVCSSSSDISVVEESNECIACEKGHVNTHTLPCNHRYLCSDCAMKFFKLSKRCKVCKAKIEQIVVED